MAWRTGCRHHRLAGCRRCRAFRHTNMVPPAVSLPGACCTPCYHGIQQQLCLPSVVCPRRFNCTPPWPSGRWPRGMRLNSVATPHPTQQQHTHTHTQLYYALRVMPCASDMRSPAWMPSSSCRVRAVMASVACSPIAGSGGSAAMLASMESVLVGAPHTARAGGWIAMAWVGRWRGSAAVAAPPALTEPGAVGTVDRHRLAAPLPQHPRHTATGRSAAWLSMAMAGTPSWR